LRLLCKLVMCAGQDGVLVKGLYLQGAGWDMRNACLVEAEPMQLVCPIPTIHFKPVESKRRSQRGTYRQTDWHTHRQTKAGFLYRRKHSLYCCTENNTKTLHRSWMAFIAKSAVNNTNRNSFGDFWLLLKVTVDAIFNTVLNLRQVLDFGSC